MPNLDGSFLRGEVSEALITQSLPITPTTPTPALCPQAKVLNPYHIQICSEIFLVIYLKICGMQWNGFLSSQI